MVFSTKSVQAEEIVARCRRIAACTEVAGETTRTFLSQPMHDVHTLLRGWMEAARMRVTVDAIGNLRGLYPGGPGGSGRLVIASHLDTVPQAGAFDGILGVVMGVALVEALQEERLPFDLEIIGFSEEEGVRFRRPYLGSLALIGALDEETLLRTDANGKSVTDAVREFGLDPTRLPEAELARDAFGYLEIHIEQGPVLESEALQLGVVSAICGQTRLEFTFRGMANHAGTTPMALRRDALVATALWIIAVEDYARSVEGLVATVGKVVTRPGVSNAIAGIVTATLDVRHPDNAIRERAAERLIAAAAEAAAAKSVHVEHRVNGEQSAVPMDEALTGLLCEAAQRVGLTPRMMVSGAGHDAMIVAPRLPAAMLFLRSPAGLSHHPDEAVRLDDVQAALATGLEFLKLIGDDRAGNTGDGGRHADA